MSDFFTCGVAILAANSICTPELLDINTFTVKDLHKYGYNTDLIIESYSKDYGIELDWWDKIRVTPTYVFEDFVVTVDTASAVSAWNKTIPPRR
jgi:hypothetical protein